MPQSYKNKVSVQFKKYDIDIINQAVKELESDPKKTFECVAKKYDIPKSVLQRHRTRKKQGGQQALSEEQEEYIIKYVNICTQWGYQVDTYKLRLFIKMCLDKSKIIHKTFQNNLPSLDYIPLFLKRNKSKLINYNRKNKRKPSKEVINGYFDKLSMELKSVDLCNIICYDEISLAVDPSCKEAISRRSHKNPEQIVCCYSSECTSQQKSPVTMMVSATGIGYMLPAYIVLPDDELQEQESSDAPEGAIFSCSKSGWFESNTFEDYFEKLIIPYFKDKPGKKILIGDQLYTNLTLEIIKRCTDENIMFIFLPPGTLPYSHPLDIAFQKPLDIAWRYILLKWSAFEPKYFIPNVCLPMLLNKLILSVSNNIESNILEGYRKAGISPIDRDKVLVMLEKRKINVYTKKFDKTSVYEPITLTKIDVRRTYSLKPQIKKKQPNVEIECIHLKDENNPDIEVTDESIEKDASIGEPVMNRIYVHDVISDINTGQDCNIAVQEERNNCAVSKLPPPTLKIYKKKVIPK